MSITLNTLHLIFFSVLRASLEATVLVLLVLLVLRLFHNRVPPKWRHAFWLLVVLRLVLPLPLPASLNLLRLLRLPARTVLAPASPATATLSEVRSDGEHSVSTVGGHIAALAAKTGQAALFWLDQWQNSLAGIWLAGTAALLARQLGTGWRTRRKIRHQRSLTDAAVLNLLEDCKQEMRIHTPLAVIQSSAVGGPVLYGFVRPRLLLPAGFTESFSSAELRFVFLHEIGHVKRLDIPMNWLTTLALALHWFNPLAWYAFHRMQTEREAACDALALSRGDGSDNQAYGRTILKVLEQFRCPAASPGMAGIWESENQMKARIHMIAKFRKTHRYPVIAVALFSGLALAALMLAGLAGTPPQRVAARPAIVAPTSSPWPKITATFPQIGATGVDPKITQITVTFDRNMAKGFSWTGGPPYFPPSPPGLRPHWQNARTCVLPVRLQAARYYRVGINSPSFMNFRSAGGVAARPAAIYFTTRGAGAALRALAIKPRIVNLVPANGARNVDPSLTAIRVTFNVPMSSGFSWTGGGPEFPVIPRGRRPYWTNGHKVCVLPVKLQPHHTYRLGLNSLTYIGFENAGDVPLDPVTLIFSTR